MKGKRILSILLAALLLALYGVQACAAWAPDAVELTKVGGWQQVEFRWKVADHAGDIAEFFARNEAGEADYGYQWLVCKVNNPDAPQAEEDLQAVPLEAGRGVYVNELKREGCLVLTLKAAPELLYGRFKVTLEVGGAVSAPAYVWLLDDDGLRDAIAAAKAIAVNRNNRYDGAYIALVQAAIGEAEALYADANATPAAIQAKVNAIDALLKAPVLALTGNAFINKLVPGWWRFVDMIDSPFRWVAKKGSLLPTMLEQLLIAVFTF